MNMLLLFETGLWFRPVMEPAILRVLAIALALGLDFLLGDPRRWPHPVKLMGWYIERFESWQIKYFPRTKFVGSVMTVSLVLGSFAIVYALCLAGDAIHLAVGFAVRVVFIYTGLSVRGLDVEVTKIWRALTGNNLSQARDELRWVVGRDTENLDEKSIARAAVETVAENTVDGVVSPLFFAFLGGAPLIVAYKAISTLDSMVGYKNEKYAAFGWASARLDDVASFIPARISAFLIPIAALVTGKSFGGALRILLRDRRKHASPNAGIPEAVVAGALGVQLGGESHYEGVPSMKPYLGDPIEPVKPDHIRQAIRLSYTTAVTSFILGSVVLFLIVSSS